MASKVGRKPVPIESRFWTKVDVRGDSECWNWKSTVARVGYGFIWFEGKQTYAHRWAYRLSKGPIENGMFVCHRCDNKLCCNPAHLFLGTNEENMKDKVNKGRQAKGNANPLAKLSPDKVIQIRKMLAEGRLYQWKIAEMFGVNQSVISRLKTMERNSWYHVKEDV